MSIRRGALPIPGPGTLVPLACGCLALALYVATAQPDLVGGDPGEFQLVAWVLGIPHHTGYPLYTMLGWLWTQLPLGSVARRMNLFSTLFGAVGVGLAAALAIRLARRASGALWGGIVAAAALAVAPLQWQWATIAGVRAGAVAEVGWILFAAVGVLLAASPTESSPERAWRPDGARLGRAMGWLALAAGVGLAHHRAGVLALPGIALAAATLPAVWRLGRGGWVRAGGLFVLPLLTYLYLPIRASQGASFHQWHPETWDGFWDLTLALGYSQQHLPNPLEAVRERGPRLIVHVYDQFGWLGIVVAAIGALWLLKRWPRAGLVLVGFLVLQSWQTLNWELYGLHVVYQLPAHLVVAVWLGLGVVALAHLAGRLVGGRWAAPLVAALLLVDVGARGLSGLAGLRTAAVRPLNHDRSALADGYAARRIVGGGLARVEPNAVVVGDWEQGTVVWYLQLVEGIKPDVLLNYPVTNLGAALKDYPDRPIWLMARTAVPADRRLSADGPFVRVGRADELSLAPPADALPRAARFEDALDLVGVAYGDRLGRRVPAPDATGDVLPVTLYWRAVGPARKDLSISVRLIDAAGGVAAQQDNASPVLSLYPTSRWREGEVVGDYYELPYRSLAPGAYQLEVRVYLVESGGFRDLRVGAVDHTDVDTVRR